jgi:hypothetical protein
MRARSQLTSSINKFGKGVNILRDAGNIAEKEMIVTGFAYAAQKTPFPQAVSYFHWNSQIRAGDICQENASGKRKLISSLEFLGPDDYRAGIRVIEIECNDSILLYELVPTAALNEYGKKNYNPVVRLNDFAFVVHNVQGDALAPIGEVDKNEIIIIFSGRNLGAYVPKEGDRLVISSGTKYQIDGIDSHVHPGSYRTLCSPDQRTE